MSKVAELARIELNASNGKYFRDPLGIAESGIGLNLGQWGSLRKHLSLVQEAFQPKTEGPGGSDRGIVVGLAVGNTVGQVDK